MSLELTHCPELIKYKWNYKTHFESLFLFKVSIYLAMASDIVINTVYTHWDNFFKAFYEISILSFIAFVST